MKHTHSHIFFVPMQMICKKWKIRISDAPCFSRAGTKFRLCINEVLTNYLMMCTIIISRKWTLKYFKL